MVLHQKYTLLSVFLFILVFVAIGTISIADLTTLGNAECNGTFDGSDSTISQKYVWANLDQMNPTLVKDVVEKATINATVNTYINTEGSGRVGVLSDGEVTGGALTGQTPSTGDLGVEWKSEAVGPRHRNMIESIFERNHTSKETDGSWSVNQALTYTLAGRGSVLAVDAGEAIGFSVSLGPVGATLTYTLGPLNLSGIPTTADNQTLTVTKNRENPDAYECSHDECSIILPDKHHHRVYSCPEDAWNPYTERKHSCRRQYYRCQTSTCPLDSWHAVDYACGHTDRKSNASAHEFQASCLYSTIQNGVTVYCSVSNYYKCKPHSVHLLPSDTSSTPPPSGSDPVPTPPSEPPTATCANGHSYNPDSSTENNLHRTLSCKYCTNTWERCVTSRNPKCKKGWRKRRNLRCSPKT